MKHNNNRQRPLYLFPEVITAVTLNGPALKIKTRGRAPKWYPIDQLSRVEIGKNVVITSNALMACIQRDILVTLYDKKTARPLATLHPHDRERNQLSRNLLAFTQLGDWRTRYQNWYTSRTTHTLRQSLGAINQKANRIDSVRLQALHTSLISQAEPEADALRHVLKSSVIRFLHRAGFSMDDGYILGPDIHLAADMSELLLIQQTEEILRHKKSPFTELETSEQKSFRQAVRILESEKTEIRQQLLEHLRELNNFITKELQCPTKTNAPGYCVTT